MFEWVTPPTIFEDKLEDYTITTFAELFDLCKEFAIKIQTAMRQNAPWVDECMPGREYLRAEAFYPTQWSVGIRVWYDLDYYRAQCGEPPFDFGVRHETMTFAVAGVVSGQRTALGSLADELMDRIKALYQ